MNNNGLVNEVEVKRAIVRAIRHDREFIHTLGQSLPPLSSKDKQNIIGDKVLRQSLGKLIGAAFLTFRKMSHVCTVEVDYKKTVSMILDQEGLSHEREINDKGFPSYYSFHLSGDKQLMNMALFEWDHICDRDQILEVMSLVGFMPAGMMEMLTFALSCRTKIEVTRKPRDGGGIEIKRGCYSLQTNKDSLAGYCQGGRRFIEELSLVRINPEEMLPGLYLGIQEATPEDDEEFERRFNRYEE